MRITKLEFNAIGPFDTATFEIPPPTGSGELVFFEGPNGCGKTTILETIAAMCSAGGGPVAIVHEDAVLRRSIARMQSGGYAALQWADGDGTASLRVNGEQVAQKANATPPDLRVMSKLRRMQMYTAKEPLAWAAFAYRAHHPTPGVDTDGPKEIGESALSGALDFGEASAVMPSRTNAASSHLGQFLTNLESARTRAATYARERTDEDAAPLLAAAADRAMSIRRMEEALTMFLARKVEIRFSVDRQSPDLLFDGQSVPLRLLGEGLRSSLAWLSDLLIRLERIEWADASKSPLHQEFALLLDEIDESLHPELQIRLYPALRALFPNARIYATTHSPFVVASVGEGVIFPIRPDPATRRVSGEVVAKRLEPGQSLELVIKEIFDSRSGIVDDPTRGELRAHGEGVRRVRAGDPIDWTEFLARRARLMDLNDEVRTIVALQEVPIRRDIEARTRATAVAAPNAEGSSE